MRMSGNAVHIPDARQTWAFSRYSTSQPSGKIQNHVSIRYRTRSFTYLQTQSLQKQHGHDAREKKETALGSRLSLQRS
jgi:hypothetical protein